MKGLLSDIMKRLLSNLIMMKGLFSAVMKGLLSNSIIDEGSTQYYYEGVTQWYYEGATQCYYEGVTQWFNYNEGATQWYCEGTTKVQLWRGYSVILWRSYSVILCSLPVTWLNCWSLTTPSAVVVINIVARVDLNNSLPILFQCRTLLLRIQVRIKGTTCYKLNAPDTELSKFFMKLLVDSKLQWIIFC